MALSLIMIKYIELAITLAACVAAGPISIRPVQPVFAKWSGDSKIIGGEEAVPHSRPYMAFIYAGGASCGGSLISPNWVLTAAHCNKLNGTPKIVLGAHNIKVTENSQVIIYGNAPIRHPQYNSNKTSDGYDIALIKLTQKAPLNDYIATVPLAPKNAGDYEWEIATASGWGLVIDNSDITSDVLRVFSETILTKAICETLWSRTILDSMICLNTANGISTCHGDSGGPLTVDNVQIGITSFGHKAGCASGYPKIFTRVSSFIDWISEIVEI